MARHGFSASYLASQVAGSCRIEGIRVSAQQEQTICDIIDGKADPKTLRRQLANQFRANNAKIAVN